MAMQSLCEAITKIQCEVHQQPLDRMCIDAKCKHKQRRMCKLCPKTEHVSEATNIYTLFHQLNELSQQQDLSISESKALLLQQFRYYKAAIIQQLDLFDEQILTSISLIQGNTINSIIEQKYSKETINQIDIEGLGDLFSQSLSTNQNLQGDQTQLIYDSDGYVRANEIIAITKSIMENCVYVGITQDNNIVQDCDYEVTQTIDIVSQCAWTCFNHDCTQMAVAYDDFIKLFNLSQEGKWIDINQRLKGHTEAIRQVKFSIDSQIIASCSDDSLIIIWSKNNTNHKWGIVDKLTQHGDSVCSISFNHDSTLLASGGGDQDIYIHKQTKNGRWKLVNVLKEHEDWINDLTFNHNSTILVSADNNQILVWHSYNSVEWVLRQKLIEHQDTICSLAFNSQSSQLISGSKDSTIRVWMVNQQLRLECIQTLTSQSAIFNVAFNREFNIILSGNEYNSIHLWVLHGNQWKCGQTISQHSSAVNAVAISNDSQMIISASDDNTTLLKYTINLSD